MGVRIRSFDHTLVGNSVYSKEEVLGCISSTPGFLPNIFAQRRDGMPSYRVHCTVFHGTGSVIGFYELMRMSFAGLKQFLR